MISPQTQSAADAEAELLARLQAQFGDLDVEAVISSKEDNNDDCCKSDDDDSESSLEEPTDEELRAWQEMQYNKGRMKAEAKNKIEIGAKSPLQHRRQNKITQQQILVPGPDLDGATSAFFPALPENPANGDDVCGKIELGGDVNPLLQKLVKEDVEVLATKWRPLYSSSEGDGLSFHNMCGKIVGYEGPTVLLLGGVPSPSKCLRKANHNDRVSLGFFTTDTWMESTEHFGSRDDCFLFSLDHNTNEVTFVRPKKDSQSSLKSSTRYMYCHSSYALTKTKHNALRGIGIGGSASRPRLHITESFERCRALAFDQLFGDGDLLSEACSKNSLYYFDVDCVEVWGVGGEEWISDALEAQTKSKCSQAAMLEQVRKIDKTQLIDDLMDKKLFDYHSHDVKQSSNF